MKKKTKTARKGEELTAKKAKVEGKNEVWSYCQKGFKGKKWGGSQRAYEVGCASSEGI